MAEMKARNKIPLPLRSSEIYDEHATTPLEYPAYLVGTLFAKLARQTMKHQPTQHDAELRVGKRKCFNNIIFKCDIEPRFSRFLADPRSQPPKHEPQTYSTTVRMSAIAIPDVLGRFRITTLTFEDLASLDGKELGPACSPYEVIVLTISKAIVRADANVNSDSRGVALKSARYPPETNHNQIDLRFAKPQGGFGFFYRAPGVASLTVKVFEGHETQLEEAVFCNEEGYAGIIRLRAEIAIVRIVGVFENLNPTQDFCFYIDDLSFGRELK